MKYIIALLVFSSAFPFAFADDACEKEMRADPIFSKIEGPLLGNEDIQKLLKGETLGMPGTVALLVGDSSTGKTHVLHTLRAVMDRDNKPHVTIRMNLVHVAHDFEPYRVESVSFSSPHSEVNELVNADRHNLEAALDFMSHEPSFGRHFIALASLLPADTTVILDLSFHDVVNNGTRHWGIYPGFNHRHVLMQLIELAAKGKERGIRVVTTARPELLHPENPDNMAVYDRMRMIDFRQR